LQRFTPITEFAAEDVFVVGYPKSGNTWFQELIAGIVYGVSPALAPLSVAQELVPDLHATPFFKRFATPMFFKSHHLPRPEFRRVVYLVRDGRDVMVSLYHYRQKRGATVDLGQLVQSGPDAAYGKWPAHVTAWLSNPYEAQMLVVKYEDLRKDPLTQLERFCAFVGVSRERSLLESVAEQTSFEKMQAKEIQTGDGHADWPRDKLFRRRGKVGSYKDEMPPEVLDVFMAEAGDTLKRCGYA
jgi:hypothetical protein